MTSWSRVKLLAALRSWVILTALFVGVGLLTENVLSFSEQRLAVEFLLLCAIVVSIQTYVGNSGLLSFGHVSFFAVGAYAAALAAIPPSTKERLVPDLPGWLAGLETGIATSMMVAVVAVVAFAVFTGVPIARMHESVIPMATLALLVMTFTVVNLWDGVTRGTRGLVSVPDLVTTWTAVASTSVICGLALLFAASPWGLRLQVVREDSVAAAVLGVSVAWSRFVGWMVSAVLMAAASTVWALNSLAFGPEQFFFEETFALLAMLIIGGMKSVSGAVAGAGLVTLLSEALRHVRGGFTLGPIEVGELSGLTSMVIALCILVVLVWRPEGLVGHREVGTWVRPRAGRSS
jgi:branched-chain amino acid transport system permease protein